MYEDYEDRWHLSLHQASQYYVTGKALAQCFDGIELEKPARGNGEFLEHTKGDKVEQLAAYLHEQSSSQHDCAEQFCRLMREILDAGDYDLREVLGIQDTSDADLSGDLFCWFRSEN